MSRGTLTRGQRTRDQRVEDGRFSTREPSSGGAASWSSAWEAGYASAAASGGQAHVVAFGDSVTEGYYSYPNPGYYLYGWVGRVEAKLAATTGVVPGTGIIPVHESIQVSDIRLPRTGTWVNAGGGFFDAAKQVATGGSTLTFGPITCETFRVVYITKSGGGAWTAAVDGGAASNYSSAGADGLVTIDIAAGALGTHTLVLTATGTMCIVSVEAICNPTTGVKVSRIALSNMQTSALNSTTNGARGSQASILNIGSADLAIIMFGLNEAYYGTTTATFQANLETLIADCKTLGASVLLVVSPPPNPVWIANWTDYRDIIIAVAAAQGCGLVDMVTAWGSYADNTAYYHDNVHPKALGHEDVARHVAAYIIEAADPAVPSAWTPADLPNLALWLDASDASTFTYSTGVQVSQWNDKSGNNRHFTQPTSGNQPLRGPVTVNSLIGVSFDGTDDWMTAGDTLDLGTNSLTFYVVATLDPAVRGSLFGKFKAVSAAGSYIFQVEPGGLSKTYYNAGSLATATAAARAAPTALMAGAIINRVAGTITQRINKAVDGTTSFTPDSGSSRNIVTSLYIGAQRDSTDTSFTALYYRSMYLLEVVACTSALGASDYDALEAYLVHKHALIC